MAPEEKRYFHFSDVVQPSDKAVLLSFKLADRINESNYLIPCRQGSKVYVDDLSKNFEIQIWFPRSIIELDEEKKILTVPDWFIKDLDAKIVKPLNFKFEILFMYIKKLWFYGDGIGEKKINEPSPLQKAVDNLKEDDIVQTESRLERIGQEKNPVVNVTVSQDDINKISEKNADINTDYDVEDEQKDQLNKLGATKEKSSSKPKKGGCSKC